MHIIGWIIFPIPILIMLISVICTTIEHMKNDFCNFDRWRSNFPPPTDLWG